MIIDEILGNWNKGIDVYSRRLSDAYVREREKYKRKAKNWM